MRISGRRLAARTAAAAAILAAAACGGSGEQVVVAPPPGPTPLSAVTLTIDHNMFSALPPITPGATITVVNNDPIRHSVTGKRPGLFDQEVEAGQTVSFKAPAEIGSHPFYCRYHAFMQGWLSIRALLRPAVGASGR